MNEKPVSVTSIINFPEKPWMAAWVVKLMKGQYEAWAAGTEPQEVRQFSQDVGLLVHFYIARALQEQVGIGKPMSARMLATANRLAAKEEVGQYANQSFLLWQKWYTNEPRKFQGVEIDLSDAELGISGRCDAILVENGKRVVVDWKTGGQLHEADALELSAYCWLASRKFHYPVVRGLLVHCPYEGNAVHVVELAEPGIVKGAATFEALLQAKTRWSDWSLFCSTGIKLGGSQ